MGNGIAEWFNSTLLNMLGMLDPEKNVDWKSHFGSHVHVYSCTKHDSTGFSPYYLMFGHHPHIAVDLALGSEPVETHTTPDRYISNLRIQLKKAYELAEVNSRNTQAEQKRLCDRHIRGAFLEIGDRVLVHNVALKGTNKIADKWSEQVSFVVSQPNPDTPVYELKPEIGKSRVKVLPVKTLKADTATVETIPAVIAEENKGMADVISVSDVSSEISFTIKPRRAPVPAPHKTRPGTPVAGQMAETIPI